MIIDQKPQAHWLLGAALVLLVPGLQHLETSPGGKVINVIMIIQVGSGDRASASDYGWTTRAGPTNGCDQ